MKRLFLAVILGVMGSTAAAAASEPRVLIYISPEKYQHPTLVGVAPLYTHWVEHTVIAEDAAMRALTERFSDVGVCEAGKSADVIVWLKPRLVYSPVSSTYYAKLKVQFHLGDGRPLATYKAEGEQYGNIVSAFIDSEVSKAYDAAMLQIMAQLQADSAIQNSIQSAMDKGFTRAPCGVVSIVGRDPVKKP
jgi:hypothetical protein